MTTYTQKNITEHPLYENASSMVIWGKKEDEVYHMMTVNESRSSGQIKRRTNILPGLGAILFAAVIFYFFAIVIPVAMVFEKKSHAKQKRITQMSNTFSFCK